MPTPKTEQRRAETKARLQQAMLERLAGSSFQELRIEDIADAAGLSRSAFYFYYPDKRALLMDAAAETSNALFQQADRWWHGEGEPAELIREALAGVAELWEANQELLCTAVEVATYDAQVEAFWRGLVGRFVTATAEHIAREQRDGVVDPGLEPRSTAEILTWGVERNLYLLSTDPNDRRPAELVIPTTELWLRAMYRRSGAS